MQLCQRLADLGVRPEFEVGERLARGFADLGFEEFCILPGGSLMSLFTGHKSELAESERQFFVKVPDVEELVDMLCKYSDSPISSQFAKSGEWQIIDEDLAEVDLSGDSHKEALIKALIVRLELEVNKKVVGV